MKNLGWLAFAFVLVVGCGGGGGGTVTGSTGGSTGGGSTGGNSGGSSGGSSGGGLAVIPSNQPGKIDVNLLTGAGRAAGTILVDIDQLKFGRAGGGELISSMSTLRVGLDGYTHDLASTSIGPLPASQDFSSLTFRISKLIMPDLTEFTASLATEAATSFRASRGRTTSLRLMLDESMLYEDAGVVTLDRVLFDAANTDSFGGKLPAFFSDMVRLDISGVGSRPMLAGGGQATYLYLSGDLYGISSGLADSFEAMLGIDRELDIEASRSGSFSGTSSGTYQLDETDPRDPAAKLKRLDGRWSDLGQVVQNVGNFLMLSFPSADATLPDQLLIISKGANGQIDACYVGEMNMQTLSFVAYPVEFLGQTPQGLVGGSITDGSTGGTFTFEFGVPPSGFPGTGSYLKFVR